MSYTAEEIDTEKTDAGQPDTEPTAGGRTRLPAPAVAAGVLVVLLVVGLGVAGLVSRFTRDDTPSPPAAAPATGPVGLVPVDAPGAGSAGCGTLLSELPRALANSGGTLPSRPIASPAPPATVAWGAGDPVVLRCGVARPAELQPTSELLDVSGVQWLQVNGSDGDNSATWYAVDRPEVVALTLPAGLGTGPIQDVSAVISGALPLAPVFDPSHG